MADNKDKPKVKFDPACPIPDNGAPPDGEVLEVIAAGPEARPEVNAKIPEVSVDGSEVNMEVPEVIAAGPEVNAEIPEVSADGPEVNTEVLDVNAERKYGKYPLKCFNSNFSYIFKSIQLNYDTAMAIGYGMSIMQTV